MHDRTVNIPILGIGNPVANRLHGNRAVIFEINKTVSGMIPEDQKSPVCAIEADKDRSVPGRCTDRMHHIHTS